MRILKHVLEHTDLQEVQIYGDGAKIISAAVDCEGNMCVWSENENLGVVRYVTIYRLFTGDEAPNELTFIDTVVYNAMVYHFYWSKP